MYKKSFYSLKNTIRHTKHTDMYRRLRNVEELKNTSGYIIHKWFLEESRVGPK